MNDDKQRPTDEGAGETSSALTRRQALMGASLVGLVVSGGGALAASQRFAAKCERYIERFAAKCGR